MLRWLLEDLKGSIVGKLDRVTTIIMACVRLHNYVITMDGLKDMSWNRIIYDEPEFTITAHPDAPLGMSYLPVIPNEDWQQYEGVSYAHAAIVEHLWEQGIGRPQYNLERKRNEMIRSPNNSVEWSREYVSPM